MSIISDLNELDFENVGNWPMATKGIAVGVIVICILAAGYFIDTSSQLDILASNEKKETDLKRVYELKQQKASNLDSYRMQMQQIEQSFGALLRQLPGKTEVADLLTDITQTGLSAGLEFELFKPQAENPVEFYAELPIKLRVRGSYHELGKFVSGVANLPRIVTLHDFIISNENNDGSVLIMEATAKTYRYLDEAEQKQMQQQASKK
jgi:type IV pilus assembly protein PilO